MAPLRRHGVALVRAHSFAFYRGRALPSLSSARSFERVGTIGHVACSRRAAHARRKMPRGSGRTIAMKSMVQLLACGCVGLLLGLPLAAGCGSFDDGDERGQPATPLVSSEELGTLQEGLTSVDMVDCSICKLARECCVAVNAANQCTNCTNCTNFNAESCAALDPGRQRTTKINCLVQLRTTISAWRLHGQEPPSACYIPGE
jgi:hypothetical protein